MLFITYGSASGENSLTALQEASKLLKTHNTGNHHRIVVLLSQEKKSLKNQVSVKHCVRKALDYTSFLVARWVYAIKLSRDRRPSAHFFPFSYRFLACTKNCFC